MANENVERVLESRIQLRNDTAANWAAVNPVLLKGEIGIEIDTRKIKIGDGIAAWENLKYVSDDIVVSETNPTDADTDYDIGELWLNKAEYKFFVLIAKNETAAVWKRIPTAEELEVVAESQVAQKLKEARKISVSGDATGETEFDGSEDANIEILLANSGTTAGTFTKFTVNEKGLIIKSELLTPDDIPELTLAKITDAGTAAARNVGSKAGNLVELGANGKIDTEERAKNSFTENFGQTSSADLTDGKTILHETDTIILNGGNA